uniref:Uncharacterized protein n=1 Tax=uncultured marine virus TaxID=186617 RepID=A0A0F7L5Q7_9VIRU|nr:hypothetical protein [uncultured marine virus]
MTPEAPVDPLTPVSRIVPAHTSRPKPVMIVSPALLLWSLSTTSTGRPTLSITPEAPRSLSSDKKRKGASKLTSSRGSPNDSIALEARR